MLTAGLTCSALANPLVDFVFLEFPETTDFVGEHGFSAEPLVDRICISDAEQVSIYSTLLIKDLYFLAPYISMQTLPFPSPATVMSWPKLPEKEKRRGFGGHMTGAQ